MNIQHSNISCMTELFCPFCGHKHSACEFQTKEVEYQLNADIDRDVKFHEDGCWQLSGTLTPYTLEQLKHIGFEIHTSCSKCDRWISINVYKDDRDKWKTKEIDIVDDECKGEIDNIR